MSRHASATARARVTTGLVIGLGGFIILLATACSPRLNWRDVRADATGLHAQLPCRPSTHARKVELGGSAREMTLLSCSAGDATWALAWVAGVDATQLAGVMSDWRRRALANVNAGVAAPVVYEVAGATPNLQAGRWRAAGRRPDGSSLVQEVAVFSRGTTVFQATMLAGRPDAAAADHFFGALRFPP